MQGQEAGTVSRKDCHGVRAEPGGSGQAKGSP